MLETNPQNRRLGDACVSTCGQTLGVQLDRLRAVICTRTDREKVTGGRSDRRELLKLLKTAGPGEVVTVTGINRLARSTFDLFAIVKHIVDAKAQIPVTGGAVGGHRHQHRARAKCPGRAPAKRVIVTIRKCIAFGTLGHATRRLCPTAPRIRSEMRRMLAACLLLPIVSHTVVAQTSAGAAAQPATTSAPAHHEIDPCDINVLLPNNVIAAFPVEIPRAVAIQAMVRDAGVDETTAGRAFDLAVKDQKRACAYTWWGWLRSW